jgi:hypothetical protein
LNLAGVSDGSSTPEHDSSDPEFRPITCVFFIAVILLLLLAAYISSAER